MTHPSFTVDDAITGQLVLNPNQLKVNGDLVTGTATLEAGTKHEKVFFYYVLESESEQQTFLQLREVVRVSFEGPLKKSNMHVIKGILMQKIIILVLACYML